MCFTKNFERYPLTLLFSFLTLLIPLVTHAQEDAQHCIPVVTGEELYMTEFHLNTIDHISGNEGYSYVTGFDNEMISGLEYSYSITFSVPGVKFYQILADFDEDLSFTGANEVLVSGITESLQVGGQITIPGLPPGDIDSRIRVIVSDSPITDACTKVYNGETTDYSLSISTDPDLDWDIIVSSGLKTGPTGPSGACLLVRFHLTAIRCDPMLPNLLTQPVKINVELEDSSGMVKNNQTKYFMLQNNQLNGLMSFGQSGLQGFSLGSNLTAKVSVVTVDLDCNIGADQLNQSMNVPHECEGSMSSVLVEQLSDGSTLRHTEGIDNFLETAGLNIFPNPFDDQITIEYKLEQGGPVNITVLDLFGRIVRSMAQQSVSMPGSYREVIDLSNLAPGTYFVQIQGEGFHHTEKLLKSK